MRSIFPGSIYAGKARAVVVRHASNHQVIAVIEVVSPGNKSSRHALGEFVAKAVDMLNAGIHRLIIDLFPAGRRDPQGINELISAEFAESGFHLPADAPMTLAAYTAAPALESFVEPAALGASLPDMPLFLTPGMMCPFHSNARTRQRGTACRSSGATSSPTRNCVLAH